ncbi:MAG: alpha/beta hydrolase [Bryobacterales bacterium]|nr:alpha/beta hydrolase [Bryobacterales bacterium]MDE0623445.1 alpha/beta hydrolase [Bryobacterales bacterium]
MNKSLKRVVLWVGAGVVFGVVATTGYQALSSHISLRNNPPPGRLVELDGRNVHLLCAGEGSPTVILEAGLPASSLTWMSVFSEIAELTRVCTYDRPGYGWSQSTDSTRTVETIAQELRMVLQRADISPPYILAGHSFGGLVMQLYAMRFPNDFVGMVLVDSSHPGQAHRTLDLREIDTISFAMKTLGPIGIVRLLFPVPAGNPESRDISVREQERELLMTNRTLRTAIREMSGLRESLRQVAESAVDLGSKPLVVLSQGQRRAESWQAIQEDLSRLSTNSEWQVVGGAGHFIQHDQPDVIVEAVRRVLERMETTADNSPP